MKKWLWALLGCSVGQAVWAQEQLQVPCAEFVQVMGAKVACDRTPVVRVEAAKWNAQLAKNKQQQCLVANGEQNLPPWKRSDKCIGPGDMQPEAALILRDRTCMLPVWKRPAGADCS